MSEQTNDSATPASATPKYDALSKRDRALVDRYLSNGMVQWTAYRDTIYSGDRDDPAKADSIRQLASRKFTDANIRDAIEERLDEQAMTAKEALYRLSEQARNEFAQYISEKGEVDLQSMIDDGKVHLIREVDYKGKDADQMVVKSHDVQGALDKILKAHGAYGAKGTEDDPVHTQQKQVIVIGGEEVSF